MHIKNSRASLKLDMFAFGLCSTFILLPFEIMGFRERAIKNHSELAETPWIFAILLSSSCEVLMYFLSNWLKLQNLNIALFPTAYHYISCFVIYDQIHFVVHEMLFHLVTHSV